jgi:hypothetical protein
MTKSDKAAKSRAVRESRQKRDAVIRTLASRGMKPTRISLLVPCWFYTVKRVLGGERAMR